jgi:hypothetical protein
MCAKRFLMAVLTGLFVTSSVMASTYTINNGATNVGELDSLRAWTTLANSGDAAEQKWIQSELGTGYTMANKFGAQDIWTVTDQSASTFATNLGLDAGDYFYVKLGRQNNAGFTHFLFENADSLSWAVLALTDSFGVGVTLEGIGKVSHIGNVSAVPIPAAGWLFGTALISFMGMCRRRRV